MQIKLTEWSERYAIELSIGAEAGIVCDVPEATVARWEDAIARYEAAQLEMSALYEHALSGGVRPTSGLIDDLGIDVALYTHISCTQEKAHGPRDA